MLWFLKITNVVSSLRHAVFHSLYCNLGENLCRPDTFVAEQVRLYPHYAGIFRGCPEKGPKKRGKSLILIKTTLTSRFTIHYPKMMFEFFINSESNVHLVNI